LLAFGVPAVVSVTACASSDQREVANTIERFYTAASQGDGGAACQQLTPAARDPVGGLACEPSIDQLGQLGGGSAKRRLAAVQVSKVRVRGDKATAQAQIPTQTPATLQLEKIPQPTLKWTDTADQWRISSLGSGPAGAF
jgi:hypothetical protein